MGGGTLKDSPPLDVQLYFSDCLASKNDGDTKCQLYFFNTLNCQDRNLISIPMMTPVSFQHYWFMNSENPSPSPPPKLKVVRTLACICFWNKRVRQLPALSEKNTENVLPRLSGALSSGSPSACDNVSPQGVNPAAPPGGSGCNCLADWECARRPLPPLK